MQITFKRYPSEEGLEARTFPEIGVALVVGHTRVGLVFSTLLPDNAWDDLDTTARTRFFDALFPGAVVSSQSWPTQQVIHVYGVVSFPPNVGEGEALNILTLEG